MSFQVGGITVPIYPSVITPTILTNTIVTNVHNQGWQFPQIDLDVQSWFPAIHTQTKQFRSRQRKLLDIVRNQQWEEGIGFVEFYVQEIPALTRAGLDQLLGSFRSKEGVKLLEEFHLNTPLINFEIIPVTELLILLPPVIASLINSFRSREGIIYDPRFDRQSQLTDWEFLIVLGLLADVLGIEGIDQGNAVFIQDIEFNARR